MTAEELYAQAKTEFPMLELTETAFVAAIEKHARGDVAAFCQRLRAGEFALAVAGNVTELERVCAGTINAACRRFEGKGHTAEDLKQILRTKLFVDGAIAEYNGQGSLESWLRVIATRLFIDLGRRKDRARETPADEIEAIAHDDLALDLVKAEYRGAVATALDQAAHALEAGDRHLLRQHLVAGLSIDQVGAVLGIHRATAARRIARAREQLATKTRELVAAQLKLDDRELAELFGLVVSKLDLSLRRLLATKP